MSPQQTLAALASAFAVVPFASAQIQFVSVDRAVYSSASVNGSQPEIQQSSTSDLGAWDAVAHTWLGHGEQHSFIGEDTVDYHAFVGSGGGAGHRGVGSSSLIAVIESPTDFRWDLTYAFDRYPYASPVLTRLRDNANMFADVDWLHSPLATFGYLEAGSYRLQLVNRLSDAGFGVHVDFNLQLSVPAPSVAPLAGLAFTAAAIRRRR